MHMRLLLWVLLLGVLVFAVSPIRLEVSTVLVSPVNTTK